jgi:metal-responsive CopG/Arc/MetJ family transcriptional regulator
MNTNTVNISFKRDLLEKIDKTASDESRSRSELIREAARMYIERKKRWVSIFNFSGEQVSKLGLKESDISKELRKVRAKKRG